MASKTDNQTSHAATRSPHADVLSEIVTPELTADLAGTTVIVEPIGAESNIRDVTTTLARADVRSAAGTPRVDTTGETSNNNGHDAVRQKLAELVISQSILHDFNQVVAGNLSPDAATEATLERVSDEQKDGQNHIQDVKIQLKALLRGQIDPGNGNLDAREAYVEETVDTLAANIDSQLKEGHSLEAIMHSVVDQAQAASFDVANNASRSEAAELEEIESERADHKRRMLEHVLGERGPSDAERMIAAMMRASQKRMNTPVGDTETLKNNAMDTAERRFLEHAGKFGGEQAAREQAAIAGAFAMHEGILYANRWRIGHKTHADYVASDMVQGVYGGVGMAWNVNKEGIKALIQGWKDAPAAETDEILAKLEAGGKGTIEALDAYFSEASDEVRARYGELKAQIGEAGRDKMMSRIFDHMGAAHYNLPAYYEAAHTASSVDENGNPIYDRHLQPEAAAALYRKLDEIGSPLKHQIFGNMSYEAVRADGVPLMNVYPHVARETAQMAYIMTGALPRVDAIRNEQYASDIGRFTQQGQSFAADVSGARGYQINAAAIRRMDDSTPNNLAYNIPGGARLASREADSVDPVLASVEARDHGRY